MKYLMMCLLLTSQLSLAANDPKDALPALHQAVIAGDLAQVKRLVQKGADINQLDRLMGNSPLHIAAQTDHPDIVQYLLDQGAFINLATPRSGMTPLHVASWYSKPDNIQVLFASPELNIELKTPAGARAEDMVGGWDRNIEPHEARLYEQLRQLFVQKRAQQHALLESQTLLNTIDDPELSEAQKTRRITALLKAGAKVNQRRPVYSNRNDWHTPLLVAAREGYADIVKVLLAYGADQSTPGYPMNAITLHKAAYMGHPKVMAALLKDPYVSKILNAQGPNNGYTPLHDAIWHGNPDVAKQLIDAGAATDLETYEQDTPKELGERYDYQRIEALLK